MLLMDGVIRAMYARPSGEPRHLAPDLVERLTINLGHICHTLAPVHRLEVDLTSSNFPRRARNTNSGHPILANDGDAGHSDSHQRHPQRRRDAFVYRASSCAVIFTKRLSRRASSGVKDRLIPGPIF